MPEMEIMKRLVLADGTILDQSQCGYSDGNLWCYLKNLSFIDAFQLFSDPEKTRTIDFEYGLKNRYTRITYTGFTDVRNVMKRELTVDINLVGSDTSITEEEVVEDEQPS